MVQAIKTVRRPAPVLSNQASDGFALSFKCLRLSTPVLEHKFHPTRLWRFDYAWPDLKLAIEKEGGIWRKGGGAHSRPKNIERDMAKYNAAQDLGWQVFRYQPSELLRKLPEIAERIRRREAALRGEGNGSSET